MSDKAYEKEKDILQIEVELGKPYIITCDKDGGWPIFNPLEGLTSQYIQEAAELFIEQGRFVGLVKIVEKASTQEE